MSEDQVDPENAPIATRTRVPPTDDGEEPADEPERTDDTGAPIVPRTRVP